MNSHNLLELAAKLLEENKMNDTTQSQAIDNDKYFVCTSCGRLLPKESAVDCYGTLVCTDCHSSYWRQCNDCGTWFDKRTSGRNVGGEWYCDDCQSKYRVCDNCGTVFPRGSGHVDHNGNWVCDNCVTEHYGRCYDCGELFLRDDLIRCSDGELRCSFHTDQYEEDERRENSGVMDYHDFNASKYKPRRVNNNDPEEKLLMGVELECDDGTFDKSEFTWWTEENHDLVHFERDGSLSDEGVECITMPCSLKYHLENMCWKELCHKLASCNFRSHNASDCGLHVHMSRSALTPVQIVKMDVFFNRGVDFWSKIGRRREIYSGSYDDHKLVDKEKGLKNYGSHESRYQVVNTINADTVELRFCRGTLNVETILGTLEMFHAVPKYLDTIPICHIYETDKNIIGFIKYMVENRDKYVNALPMMRRLVRDGRYASIVGECYGKYIEAKFDGEDD